ncbi:MAG: hypothetical protein V1750_02825, partial [Acidobacteriota bacterium]
RRRRAAAPPEAFIGADGLLVGGQFHSWNVLTSRLDKATVKEKKTPTVVVIYSYATKSGRSSTTVRVPVPDGRLEEARAVVAQLAATIAPTKKGRRRHEG